MEQWVTNNQCAVTCLIMDKKDIYQLFNHLLHACFILMDKKDIDQLFNNLQADRELRNNSSWLQRERN